MSKTIWTMVAANYSNGHYVSFTMIANNYMLEEWNLKSAIQHLKSNECVVTNLGVNNKGEISAVNGAIEKYTRFDADKGVMMGKPANVVLNRIERGNKLIGYTVFAAAGSVKKLSISDVLKVYSTEGIANGKIRHTSSGDIISSISGEYPIMDVDVERQDTEAKIKAEVIYICDVIAGKNKVADYAGVLLHGNAANPIIDLMALTKASNKSARNALHRVGAEELEKSMETLRLAAAKYFVVMSTADLDKIKSMGVEVSGNKGKTIISRLIFKKPGEYIEARAASKEEAEKKRSEMTGKGLTQEEVDSFIGEVAAKVSKYTK